MKSKELRLFKVVIIQESITRGVAQNRVTIAKDFMDLLGWKKGDKVKSKLILGSNMLCFEKVEK